jgi:multiple sugar transport system permease protein
MKKLNFAERQRVSGVIFVLPCMAVLLMMMVYPLIQTVMFSFSDIKLPRFDLTFAGFKNFARVFSRPEIPEIIRNTLVWTAGSVVFRFILGMITALVMNSGVPGAGFLRVLVLIPWTVPSIVAANTWRWMLQGDFGVINGMLKAWNLERFAFSWLTSEAAAIPALLLAVTWAGYPFIMMMMLSAMQGLPKEYYEAAMVDGTNALQRFWHITIPGIKPVLLILLALETISAMNAFDMIYIMTGGGPGFATEIFGLFVYRIGFKNLDFAGASAASVVMIAIVMALFAVYLVIQRRNSGTKETER